MDFAALPHNRYGALLVDPPWDFRVRSDKGKGRSAERHYAVPSFEDVARLPVADIAAKDCALFLWVTDPMLPKGLGLIERWGFTYKTVGFYWIKTTRLGGKFFTGLGYWTRANPEQCLLATRGSPKRLAKDVKRLIPSARREHSRKPDEIYGRIERLVAGPYLELFARQPWPGWDAWGNETTKFAEAAE